MSNRPRPTWEHADRPVDQPVLDAVVEPRAGRLTDDRRSLSAGASADAVARLAGWLRAQGVERGDVVAWQSPNRWEAVALLRACWRLGAVAAPVHHLAGPADLERIVAGLGPKVIIDPDDVTGAVERGQPVAPRERPDGEVESSDPAGDVAVVLHTSGSSGEPKGVMHTHASLAYKARLMAEVHRLAPGDAVLMPAPLAHISGLQNAVTLAGAAGLDVVLMARWDPDHALDLIEQHGITFMIGPPTFFVSLLHASSFRPERVATLSLISCGGAGVTPSFVARAADAFGAVVKRTYGSTEAPTVTTSHAGDDPGRAATTDGRPTGRVRLKLGPADELWLRGPELFVGYTNAARTAEAVVADHEGEWFRTGDVARLDPDGWLTIVGRIKDLIIRGGENIAAAEVESTLEAHPAVRQAAAVGEPDERLGERVCAFVVLKPGARFDLDECRRWFAERGVTRFKTPERVVELAELPLMPSGKPDRSALHHQAALAARHGQCE